MLIDFSGLPGTGKSTVADGVARARRLPVFSVDPIESAIVGAGIEQGFVTGLAAYLVVERLADGCLAAGLDVVIDAVNSVEPAREMWRKLARKHDVELRVIECVLGDGELGRARLGARERALAIPEPTWLDVERRRAEWAPWPEAHCTLDAAEPAEANVARALAWIDEGEQAPGAGGVGPAGDEHAPGRRRTVRGAVRAIRTRDLTPAEVAAIRALLWEAFASDDDPFTEDDWEHAAGGMHFVLEQDGVIAAHASVVEREILVGGVPLRTGYVEAVATLPRLQGRGLGSRVMEATTAHVRERFELGALGTGRHRFYERLGWMTWLGPTSVVTPEGTRRTPGDDGYVMVLSTAASPSPEVTAPVSCRWRRGEAW